MAAYAPLGDRSSNPIGDSMIAQSPESSAWWWLMKTIWVRGCRSRHAQDELYPVA
jgi:hypothetical protein